MSEKKTSASIEKQLKDDKQKAEGTLNNGRGKEANPNKAVDLLSSDDAADRSRSVIDSNLPVLTSRQR